MYVFKYEETHKAMVSVEESMFAERRLVLEPSKEITAAAMAGDESKVFAWLDGWSWSEAVKLGQPGEELIATIDYSLGLLMIMASARLHSSLVEGLLARGADPNQATQNSFFCHTLTSLV